MELVVMMGSPGAGKSSFYRQRFESTHELVSKDLMKKKKNKSLKQQRALRNLFQQRHSVVVDNMNVSLENRRELVALAKEFEAKVVLYYFPLTPQESYKRNEGPNRTIVPPVAIFSSAKILKEPSYEEGFDEIYLVQMITPDEFKVTEVTR